MNIKRQGIRNATQAQVEEIRQLSADNNLKFTSVSREALYLYEYSKSKEVFAWNVLEGHFKEVSFEELKRLITGTVRVRIKEQPHSRGYWIRNQVGQVFEVKPRPESVGGWSVSSGNYSNCGINSEDAEVVEENMKIRVIRKEQAGWGNWVNEHLGEVFEVVERNAGDWSVKGGEYNGNGIVKYLTVPAECFFSVSTVREHNIVAQLIKHKSLGNLDYNESTGFILVDDTNNFSYQKERPSTREISFQEFVEMVNVMEGKPSSGEYELNDSYTAKIHKDGKVVVGCQEFKIDDIKSILKIYEELQ